MGSHSTGDREQEYSVQGYSIQGQMMHKGDFGPPETHCTRGHQGDAAQEHGGQGMRGELECNFGGRNRA